ncbi:MAG TPA: hypothetical protein VE223_00520 [Nitrososphaeraceae archaeon]|nr:hypothetical protein [Nitrososphaeraceae archaeon]
MINSKAVPQRNANQIKTKISSPTLNHSDATKRSNGLYVYATCPIDRTAPYIPTTSKYNKSNIHSYPEDEKNDHIVQKHAKTICNITRFLDFSESGSTIKARQYQFPRVTANDYGDIPFIFPMPLQDMHSDSLDGSTHSNSKKSPHLKNGIPSNIMQKQRTILRAILIPDKKIIEKTKVADSSKNSTTRFEGASSHPTLSSNNISKGILTLQYDHQNYPISYEITGAGNKLNDINVENDNTTIITRVTSKSNGILTIQLPGDSMINFKKPKNNQQDSFAVFEDGQYYPYNEGQYIHGVRKEMVYFEKGTEQIEILTSHASPEFGMTFPIAFSLAVISLMVVRMYFLRCIRQKRHDAHTHF